MLLARRAIAVIDADLATAADQAAALADAHADTVMAGRTLLQQAVPVTFGLVAAGWLTAHRRRAGASSTGSARPGWRSSSAARRHAGLARRTPGQPSPRCSPPNLAWPSPCCPWHTDRLRIVQLARGAGRRLRRARQDRQGCDAARADRGRRGRRGLRLTRGRAGRRPCRTSGTRSRRSSSSAAPGAHPACWRRWPQRPSRSISARPAPGTRSGRRWPTCCG